MPPTLRLRCAAATAVTVTVAAALALAPGSASAGPVDDTPQTRVEIPGPEGKGAVEAGSGHTWVPVTSGTASRTGRPSPAESRADGDVSSLVDNGPSGDRLDVVIVGDGYTLEELGRFHADAVKRWAEFTGVEPYTTYRDLFNVWMVDAVSQDSGVSGDPGKDVVRNTALGSYFWCDGVERLLCVDEKKVDSYVAKAPEADLVLVLSNSSKYGGAGYNTPSKTLGYEGISTASAGNEKSGQVAIHETGHSLGKLADEYFYADYPGYEKYEGKEPGESNISTLTADGMRTNRTKWYRWLGETSPDGGLVGAYEGGGYYVTGLNRPTDASLMRILDKPFSLPGREAMIGGFYRHANPVTPRVPTDRTLRRRDIARVDVPRLSGERQLDIQWYLDGKRLAAHQGHTAVPVSALPLDSHSFRRHHLTVVVTDRTDAVRDPAVAVTLQSTATWAVRY
jgi:hypothetical protein